MKLGANSPCENRRTIVAVEIRGIVVIFGLEGQRTGTTVDFGHCKLNVGIDNGRPLGDHRIRKTQTRRLITAVIDQFQVAAVSGHKTAGRLFSIVIARTDASLNALTDRCPIRSGQGRIRIAGLIEVTALVPGLDPVDVLITPLKRRGGSISGR